MGRPGCALVNRPDVKLLQRLSIDIRTHRRHGTGGASSFIIDGAVYVIPCTVSNVFLDHESSSANSTKLCRRFKAAEFGPIMSRESPLPEDHPTAPLGPSSSKSARHHQHFNSGKGNSLVRRCKYCRLCNVASMSSQ